VSRAKQLLKATVIYAVGNIGTKIISFLIVPLYTFYIIPSDMGMYDLLYTTSSLVIPFLIWQITDGILRWMLDKDFEKTQVIKAGLQITLRNILVSIPIYLIVDHYIRIPFGWYFIVFVFSQAILTVLSQITRGLGDNKLFAYSGIINAIILVSLNYIQIVQLKMGVESFFISGIASNTFTIVYILVKQPIIIKSFSLSYNRELSSAMVKYSLLLIPNILNWFVINASDRYIIYYYLGAESNGIYSLAYKFPMIIQMLTSIFYLAWQENAISEHDQNKVEQNKYYSELFHAYSIFLLSISIIGIGITKYFVLNLMNVDYHNAWKYTGFLYLGTVYSAFSSFYGVGYQIARKPIGAFFSTVAASIANIVINIALIKYIGIHAASISTFLAFVILFFTRRYQTKNYFSIAIKWEPFISLNIIGIFYIFISLVVDNIYIEIFMVLLSIGIFLFSNRKMFQKISRIIKTNSKLKSQNTIN